MGPILSFKGIDNAAYYRLKPDDRRYYMDYTGAFADAAQRSVTGGLLGQSCEAKNSQVSLPNV
jgi:pullulanase/glycogen debranching enzyme